MSWLNENQGGYSSNQGNTNNNQNGGGGYFDGNSNGGAAGNGYNDYFGGGPLGYDGASPSAPQKVKFGERLKRAGSKFSEWHKKASPQSKQVLYVFCAGLVATLVIVVCSFIFKHKKKQIDEQFIKDKEKSIAAVRENGGLPRETLPNVPGEFYEKTVLKLMQMAQYHHDKAIKSTNPVYKHEELCLAIGIIASLTELSLPETIQQVTNVHVNELLQRLNETKMAIHSQFGKISPLLKQTAPFAANAAVMPSTTAPPHPTTSFQPQASQVAAAAPTRSVANQHHQQPTVVAPAPPKPQVTQAGGATSGGINKLTARVASTQSIKVPLPVRE